MGVKFSWNGKNRCLGAAHTNSKGEGSWGNFLGVVCSPAIKALWRLHPKELRGSQTDYEPLSFTPFRDEGSGNFDPDKNLFCRVGFSRITGLL